MISEVQGIYVVRSLPGLPVKVGVTQDLRLRLQMLQCGNWNPLEAHWFSFCAPKVDRVSRNFFNSVTRSAFRLEQLVHAKMKELDLWVGGEWFDCEPDAAVMVIKKVAALSDIEFFDISAMRSLAWHGRLPPETIAVAQAMINAEESARAALALDGNRQMGDKRIIEEA